MLNATDPLPVLSSNRPLRLTPTDVSQFVRLEQCERFLRFRLAERAGGRFMEEYDVTPQPVTPLLSLSGHNFEKDIEKKLDDRFRTIHFADKHSLDHNRDDNNQELVDEINKLKAGDTVILLQVRLSVELEGWLLRGDADLLRLERKANGTLHILLADMKSTTEVKVEHRLQVAFYRLMLERLFQQKSVAHAPIEMAILFRPPADPSPEEETELEPLREASRRVFGFDDALLEIMAEPDAYLQSAYDLVLANESTARRIALTSFDKLPYALSFKCDGCLYNEFCMKWSAEHEDLSLLPHMTGTEKEALRRTGITTIQSLAALKEFVPDRRELIAASG